MSGVKSRLSLAVKHNLTQAETAGRSPPQGARFFRRATRNLEKEDGKRLLREIATRKRLASSEKAADQHWETDAPWNSAARGSSRLRAVLYDVRRAESAT